MPDDFDATRAACLRAGCAVLDCAGSQLFVAPAIGGALAAWRWRGRDVLRPPEAGALERGDVRALACYPLIPYSNRIAGATLTWNGVSHALAHNFGDHPNAIHGLGWQSGWDVLDRQPGSIRLGLTHAADTAQARAAWPWPFTAEQRFHLAAADGALVLCATLTIASTADEPFPFGLGWHPYFPRDDATLLGFAARSVWRNDATQLPVECVAIPPEWNFAPPRPVDGVVLDQVFNGWTGHATVRQPSQQLHVRIDADTACGHLVVYAPAGRDYLAVEPVTHETDAFNRAARGARDTGTRLLAPGQAFSCTMRVTVHPLG